MLLIKIKIEINELILIYGLLKKKKKKRTYCFSI